MNRISEIKGLISKDFKLELRNRASFFGIILYVILVIFVCFLAFKNIYPETWNALFWILLLFASVNATGKSFIQENDARYLYYYTTVHPHSFLTSKLIYNFLILTIISAITLLFYSLVLGFPIQKPLIFCLTVLLGVIGFAGSFTISAAIAAKARQNVALMVILSLPLILPMIMLVIKISSKTLQVIEISTFGRDLSLLAALDLITIALGYLLFPYLWQR